MNVKQVVLMDANGEPIRIFNSIKALAKEFGTNYQNITYHLRKKDKFMGYRFMLYTTYQRIFLKPFNLC